MKTGWTTLGPHEKVRTCSGRLRIHHLPFKLMNVCSSLHDQSEKEEAEAAEDKEEKKEEGKGVSHTLLSHDFIFTAFHLIPRCFT